MRRRETNPYLQFKNVPIKDRLNETYPTLPDELYSSAINQIRKTFTKFDYLTNFEYEKINSIPTLRVTSEDLILTLRWDKLEEPRKDIIRRCLSCGRTAVRKNICAVHDKPLKEKGHYSVCAVIDCTNIINDSDISTCDDHTLNDLPLEDQKYFLQKGTN